jgi:hypothetical protein
MITDNTNTIKLSGFLGFTIMLIATDKTFKQVLSQTRIFLNGLNGVKTVRNVNRKRSLIHLQTTSNDEVSTKKIKVEELYKKIKSKIKNVCFGHCFLKMFFYKRTICDCSGFK